VQILADERQQQRDRGEGHPVDRLAKHDRDDRPAALARAARARGLSTVDGGFLLGVQAAYQADLFAGRRASAEVVSFALEARSNLVLVGPRGAGKTTVGRLVARRLGRPFVDTDEEIGRETGRPAGRVLEASGEASFRMLEARLAARALARRGAVIALGGGALETDATLASVRHDAFVVWLDVGAGEAARRIERDATSRPRLTSEADLAAECARLAAARGARYATAAVHVVTTGRDPARVADEVADHWLAASATS
jgi:shikimate kinase